MFMEYVGFYFEEALHVNHRKLIVPRVINVGETLNQHGLSESALVRCRCEV